jgi:hypothetical protein
MPKWAVRFLIELLKLVIGILEDLVANGNGDFVESSEDQARGIVGRRLAERGSAFVSAFGSKGPKVAGDANLSRSPGA